VITVNVLFPSGDMELSALVGDGRACGPYYERQRYSGYTEGEALRLFVEHLHRSGKRIDDGDPVYEAPCRQCGAVCLTDEWAGGAPYFGSGCECGGEADTDAWHLSDEPHPSVWA
jgi:hypothetical protein